MTRPIESGSRTGLNLLAPRWGRVVVWCPAALVVVLAGCSRSPESTGGSEASRRPQLQFVECAAAAGLSFRHDNGFDGSSFRVAETVNGGLGLLDMDRDYLLEVFFTSAQRPGASSHNALYRRGKSGQYEDVTEAAGLGAPGFSFGCSSADLNADGFPEILVTRWGGLKLYRNERNGRFTEVAEASGLTASGMFTGSAFLDMDRDGDLDLYVAAYVLDDAPEHPPLVVRGARGYWPPRNYKPGLHFLFENTGGMHFRDVSATSGIRDVVEPGRGLGVVAADFNGDGCQDLYVANDMSANFMFLGDGRGKFTEVGFANGTALGEQGEELGSMGIAVGDFDGDLRLDLHVTNYQNQINNLYRCRGDHYEDVARAAGLAAGNLSEVAWGTGLIDLDLDGHLDLFIANGHLNPETEQMDQGTRYAQAKRLFLGRGGGKLEDVSRTSGEAVLRPGVARGAAFGDLDNDGDTDLVINRSGESPELLRNECPPSNAWVALLLEGRGENLQAIGARVQVTAGDRVQVAERQSSGSFLSSHEESLRFGLGGASSVERLEVRWPTGEVETWTTLPARKLLLVRQGRKEVEARDLVAAPLCPAPR